MIGLIRVSSDMAEHLEQLLSSILHGVIGVQEYVVPADNGDLVLAINRAFSQGKYRLRLPAGDVQFKTTLNLTGMTGVHISGDNSTCVHMPKAVDAAGANLIPAIIINGCTDVSLTNFSLDGGWRNVVTVKRSVRGIRILDSSQILFDSLNLSYIADWAVSFERCDRVTVTNYTYDIGEWFQTGATVFGGRDGMHFIDCTNFRLDGFTIYSGDDCVGCTVETVGQYNGVITNGLVFSKMANGIIVNEEGAAVKNSDNIRISNISVMKGQGLIRNIVRCYTINVGSKLTNVQIDNISGESYAESIWVQGNSTYMVENVTIHDIDTKCVGTATGGAHGVRLKYCQNMRLSGNATTVTAATANFDGWHLEDCNRVSADVSSNGADYYGINLLRVQWFRVHGNVVDGGAQKFSSNNGGHLLISNCSNGYVSGSYVGALTKSYNGIVFTASNSVRCEPGTVVVALNNTVIRGPSNLWEPDAYACCVMTGGSITTVGESQGCTVTGTGGVVTVDFTVPRRSTYYNFEIQAFANGAERRVVLTKASQTQLVFSLVDAAGAAATTAGRLLIRVYQSM